MKHTTARLIRFLFLASVAGIWLAAPRPCKADSVGPNAVGFIKQVNGTVTVLRSGHHFNAARSAPVLLHDKFTTSRRSSIEIALNTGGELDMSESSSLEIDQYIFNSITGANSTLIDLLVGKLRSIVPFASGKTDFKLRTGNAICGVRGTEFETAYIVGKPCPGFPKCLRYTDVGVGHGTVEVRSTTNPTAKPVSVTAGYETTVPCEIPPSSPSPLGASELELPGYR